MRTSFRMVATVGVLLAAPACAPSGSVASSPAGGFALTSSAFGAGAAIPLRNSPYGENVSPALTWSNVPPGTQSLALVLEDPDATTPQPFVHWVIYNIPASATGLPEGLAADPVLNTPATIAGTRQGITGLRRPGYFGPRPPAGPVHNYHFVLYALSTPPNLPEGLTAEQLRERIGGNTLGETRLIGTYQQTQ